MPTCHVLNLEVIDHSFYRICSRGWPLVIPQVQHSGAVEHSNKGAWMLVLVTRNHSSCCSSAIATDIEWFWLIVLQSLAEKPYIAGTTSFEDWKSRMSHAPIEMLQPHTPMEHNNLQSSAIFHIHIFSWEVQQHSRRCPRWSHGTPLPTSKICTAERLLGSGWGEGWWKRRGLQSCVMYHVYIYIILTLKITVLVVYVYL